MRERRQKWNERGEARERGRRRVRLELIRRLRWVEVHFVDHE
jgi:hypothetical protein